MIKKIIDYSKLEFQKIPHASSVKWGTVTNWIKLFNIF